METKEKSRINFLIKRFEKINGNFEHIDFYNVSNLYVNKYLNLIDIIAKKIAILFCDYTGQPDKVMFLSHHDIFWIKKAINE